MIFMVLDMIFYELAMYFYVLLYACAVYTIHIICTVWRCGGL